MQKIKEVESQNATQIILKPDLYKNKVAVLGLFYYLYIVIERVKNDSGHQEISGYSDRTYAEAG